MNWVWYSVLTNTEQDLYSDARRLLTQRHGLQVARSLTDTSAAARRAYSAYDRLPR